MHQGQWLGRIEIVFAILLHVLHVVISCNGALVGPTEAVARPLKIVVRRTCRAPRTQDLTYAGHARVLREQPHADSGSLPCPSFYDCRGLVPR